ncbi:response regulator transcription factor [Mucilaginibacter sp. CSA2-8R]|uniref:response regulator transcription factor n=1 Tax=Mucilaginibacter sp. CSA2-8R TaxID=3141542 RepID=UPI00315DAFBB
MIRIILVEDHTIVRDGLKIILQSNPEFVIAAEAANGQEALKLLKNGVTADVILTDLNMPVMGGLDLAASIAERYPTIRLIVLSGFDNEKFLLQAFKAGAKGYLLKNVQPRELKFAISHVHEGAEYICSELTSRFMHRMLSLPDLRNEAPIDDVKFSDRDIDVLNYLAEGLTNQEIADKLFTSKRTVEGYRENMINRTGVRNTVALIRYAIIHGIIS